MLLVALILIRNQASAESTPCSLFTSATFKVVPSRVQTSTQPSVTKGMDSGSFFKILSPPSAIDVKASPDQLNFHLVARRQVHSLTNNVHVVFRQKRYVISYYRSSSYITSVDISFWYPSDVTIEFTISRLTWSYELWVIPSISKKIDS